MSNDHKPPEATAHRFFLYSVGCHDNGREFFDLLAEHEIHLDERGPAPHRDKLLSWAIAHVRESTCELGLFCAEFSPIDAHGVPERSLAQHYFTWGVGTTIDGEANQSRFSLGA